MSVSVVSGPMNRRCPLLLSMVKRSTMSTAFALLSALVFFAVSVKTATVEAELACFPSDYARQSQACSGNSREVQYVAMRNCSQQFDISQSYTEDCDCTPYDFLSVYSFDKATNSCWLTYKPIKCDGSPSRPMEVDKIYCDLETTPCTLGNITSTYTQCNKTTAKIGLVYYFDGKCNPLAPGSVHLPPVSYIECDIHCVAGTFLSGTKCQTCPNGTFSVGGGILFQGFTELDNSTFKTTCTYTGLNGTAECQKNRWRAEGLSLKVGPFDPPNEMYQDECAENKTANCHNGLSSALIMNVRLVRDGHVRFNYSVDAEKNYDGLSFYVDDVQTMPLKSFTISVEDKQFALTVGFHKLSWVFSKDEKWTQGKDSAAITLIEVDGTDFNDQGCTQCLPGYYSVSGAASCTPCPENTYTDQAGQAKCLPCGPDFYAPTTPRTNCTIRPVCNVEKDSTTSYGPCMARTQKKLQTYSWLEPRICKPLNSKQLPQATNVSCGSCPVGQRYVDNTKSGTRSCELCPSGSARGADEKDCHVCEKGKAAVRELNLGHFSVINGSLPDGFTSGCNGDCGSSGWRAVNDYMDSGSGHGGTVSVWLSLNVTMEMVGSVRYNFSVDIPEGDTERGFFFYIDDELTDDWQDDGYDEEEDDPIPVVPMWSDPFYLTKGTHHLMWVWVKLNADSSAKRDSAIIYEIQIKGESRGGAADCEDVPKGSMLLPGGTSWLPCPPGSYSLGKTSSCLPCPPNTYNPNPGMGLDFCLPCNPGTSSLANSTDCFIGDVTVPSSFCTYSPPPSVNGTQLSEYTLFDLSPLSRLHPHYMFGPVYENASSPQKENGALYYVNICERSTSSVVCTSVTDVPMNTFLCKVWAKTSYDSPTHKRPATDLGNSVALLPLSSDPKLNRRGFRMEFEGELCPFISDKRAPRLATITFVCDPASGYGQPEAWTSEARITVFDPDSPFPWVNRNGTLEPVKNNDLCSHDMIWYSAYACPMCSGSDYDTVDLQGCVNSKKSTSRLKDPKVCQVNPLTPLPPDTLCEPCTADDIVVFEQDCVDSNGDTNITYSWKQPLPCSPDLPNSAKLPDSFHAGPCFQNVTIVNPTISRVEKGLVGAGAFLVLVLSIISCVMYAKNRRIYSAYAKLLESERPGDFHMEGIGGVDSPEREDDMNLKMYSGRYSTQ